MKKIKGFDKPEGNKKTKLYHGDCLELMKQLPDNYFDLAITDLPYGINTTNDQMGGRKVNKKAKGKSWDKELLSIEYYDEIMRVSEKWIFWGANWMPMLWKVPRKNVIVFDKKMRDLDFADCEIAVSNIDDGARVYTRSGTIKDRIHVNEKAVELYAWTLSKYAEKKYRVFDPTLGSGNSAIAAHYFGVKEFVGCEKDDDYFPALVANFNKVTAQKGLFEGFGV